MYYIFNIALFLNKNDQILTRIPLIIMKLKILDIVLKRIKIIKLAKVLRLNPHFFFDLVIFHFSKLFRANVNDNLIVLGAANGKAFIGNPKYLYIFLKKNTNYRSIRRYSCK